MTPLLLWARLLPEGELLFCVEGWVNNVPLVPLSTRGDGYFGCFGDGEGGGYGDGYMNIANGSGFGDKGRGSGGFYG
jgi:hypothetical protein